MMEIGRQKVKQLGLENTISFAKEDCLNLSSWKERLRQSSDVYKRQLR